MYPSFAKLNVKLGVGRGVEEADGARVRCAWAEFKRVIFHPGSPWCIISCEMKDIQSLCPECVDIWD